MGLRGCAGLLLLTAIHGAAPGPLQSADDAPTPEQTQFFEAKVRPLFIEHCFSCHGPDKQKSGLRVDSRAALLAGGDTGAAVQPGQPAASLLIDAINYKTLQMPPDRRLTAEQIGILTQWVQDGAIWPNDGSEPTGPVVRKPGLQITDADRSAWAFQPIRRPMVPEIADDQLARNSVDRFLLSKLAERGLTYSPLADPRTRLRRLSFDLRGLPPTLAEVEAFAADPSPEAYERLMDDYLASPAYGERWGRHWLDLVRYAQTNGYERDDEKPHIWRYRDYVISAFNADKPYDLFVREQLAGDEVDYVTPETLIATGYYRLGVWDDEPDDLRQAEFDDLDDMLATTSSVFLGLTIGCARCHDHKFDPITHEDYYSLLSFIRNVKRYVKPDDKAAVGTILAELSTEEHALAVFEHGATTPTVQILSRGNAATPGQDVVARFPQVFGSDLAVITPAAPMVTPEAKSSRRRRQLADWLTDARHPLTARVIVNRLWQHHFGVGLTPTPSDFGKTGLPCTHPELLDELASELIASGWSLKHIHRLILTSAAFQQSSHADQPAAVAVDPANTLLWRQNLRRLEAEAIRDATLAATGTLNQELYGTSIYPELSAEVLSTQSIPGRGWGQSTLAQQHRRSVYIFVKRTLGVPVLDAFDLASPDSSQASRNTTTIAPQALIMLNGSFAEEQATALADRVLAEPMAERISRAFAFALLRRPTEREHRFTQEYLERQRLFWRDEAGKLRLTQSEQSTKNQPTEFAGWTAYGGSWSLPEPGVCAVEPDAGAKLVRDDIMLQDGSVECQVRLDTGGDGGVLLRVTEPQQGTDALKAYNINFTPTQLRLGKHENNWRELASADLKFPPGEWMTLRAQVTGSRIQVFVNGANEPAIDFNDPDPLPAGKLGLRTFQAKVAFRGLQVHQGEKTTALSWERRQPMPSVITADEIERQVWTAMAKVLLNLNEFVYVD